MNYSKTLFIVHDYTNRREYVVNFEGGVETKFTKLMRL